MAITPLPAFVHPADAVCMRILERDAQQRGQTIPPHWADRINELPQKFFEGRKRHRRRGQKKDKYRK